MHDFKDFLKSDDSFLKKINVNKVSKNIENILKKLDVKFTNIESDYRRVFGGGSEIVFYVKNAVIDGKLLKKFSIVIMHSGDIIANASYEKRRYLVTTPKVGTIKSPHEFLKSRGIFYDILEWTVNEIRDQLEEV